ncbi:MAG: PqqD family protein [Desulfomonile tiedjei]|uniref:PqqD family protein n=1 Tax=Desulfomonile tiedjei TaxID=2358 RepID=A0A9D6UZM3_9BACT|nr:PqqD family protein [Desulfomonile tiedjei]
MLKFRRHACGVDCSTESLLKSTSESPKQIIFEMSTVAAVKDQVSRDLDGEAAILNLNTGIYYGLNSVGARIWELLSEPKPVSQILETLLQEYDVDTERCQSDLMRLLEDLAEAGLIEVRNEGAP